MPEIISKIRLYADPVNFAMHSIGGDVAKAGTALSDFNAATGSIAAGYFGGPLITGGLAAGPAAGGGAAAGSGAGAGAGTSAAAGGGAALGAGEAAGSALAPAAWAGGPLDAAASLFSGGGGSTTLGFNAGNAAAAANNATSGVTPSGGSFTTDAMSANTTGGSGLPGIGRTAVGSIPVALQGANTISSDLAGPPSQLPPLTQNAFAATPSGPPAPDYSSLFPPSGFSSFSSSGDPNAGNQNDMIMQAVQQAMMQMQGGGQSAFGSL